MTEATDAMGRAVADHLASKGLFAADSLDAAWAEAEAALPEGYGLRVAHDTTVPLRTGYVAEATDWESLDVVWGDGPTPAAALRALAEKLREAKG